MININELRLGNLVYKADTDTVLTVESMMGVSQTIIVVESNVVYKPEDLNPIIICGDTLERFKPHNITTKLMNDHEHEVRRVYRVDSEQVLKVCFVTEDYEGNGLSYYRLRLNDDNVSLFSLTRLRYIHQLQNLVYCLTGKEFKDIAEKETPLQV